MRRSWVVLALIVALGIVLRGAILTQRGSFWFDEAFSVHFASMDLKTMWQYLKFENNPPLYFALLHFWMKLVGNSEIAVRALSMMFGIASIPLVYVLGKRLHSAKAGLFAAFLMAISTFQAFYSTETRMYSLYLFLALLTIIVYRKLEERRAESAGGIGLRILFFIILSTLIWTHITAWMIVGALGIYIFWKSHFSVRALYNNHKKFLIIVGLLVLQFLPWIINFIKLKIASPLSQGYFFYIPPDKNFFLTILENFLVFGQDNAFIVTLLSIVIVVLLWFALDIRRSNIRFLLCWLFVPLLIGFAFSNAIPRYFIAVSPALYLLLGIGFVRAADFSRPWDFYRRRTFPLVGFGVPLLVFALILPDYPSLQKIGHHQWDKLASWIIEHESHSNNAPCSMLHAPCLILVNPHSEILPFERYYEGTLPVIGFYPKDDSDDRDLRIVKTNWLSLNTKENVPLLRDVTERYRKVFLVTGGIDPVGRNLVPLWFWENGWRKLSGQEFGRISVVLVEKVDI